MDDETPTPIDETKSDEADKPSLKEKISKIDFKKWGKRVAIAGVVTIVTVGLVAVVRSSETDNEE